jgi:5-methylcytosine-specific restriction endonuclease McrA
MAVSSKRRDPRLTRDYKAFRLKVLARDQYTCYYCQQPADTVDHVIPISQAPDLVVSFDNAVSACKSCNSSKGSRSQGVFLERKSTPYVFDGNLSPQKSTIHQDSPFQTKPVTN